MQADGSDAMLDVMIPVFLALAVAWIVLATLAALRRRAYNLTPAESAPAGRIKPDFLTVDRGRRQAAMAAGAAFDAAAPPRPGPPAPVPGARLAQLSRLLALLSAILTFVAAAVTAVEKVETVQTVYDRMNASMVEFAAVIARHRIGFAFAAAVIAVNFAILIIQLLRVRRS